MVVATIKASKIIFLLSYFYRLLYNNGLNGELYVARKKV